MNAFGAQLGLRAMTIDRLYGGTAYIESYAVNLNPDLAAGGGLGRLRLSVRLGSVGGRMLLIAGIHRPALGRSQSPTLND